MCTNIKRNNRKTIHAQKSNSEEINEIIRKKKQKNETHTDTRRWTNDDAIRCNIHNSTQTFVHRQSTTYLFRVVFPFEFALFGRSLVASDTQLSHILSSSLFLSHSLSQGMCVCVEFLSVSVFYVFVLRSTELSDDVYYAEVWEFIIIIIIYEHAQAHNEHWVRPIQLNASR